MTKIADENADDVYKTFNLCVAELVYMPVRVLFVN